MCSVGIAHWLVTGSRDKTQDDEGDASSGSELEDDTDDDEEWRPEDLWPGSVIRRLTGASVEMVVLLLA